MCEQYSFATTLPSDFKSFYNFANEFSITPANASEGYTTNIIGVPSKECSDCGILSKTHVDYQSYVGKNIKNNIFCNSCYEKRTARSFLTPFDFGGICDNCEQETTIPTIKWESQGLKKCLCMDCIMVGAAYTRDKIWFDANEHLINKTSE